MEPSILYQMSDPWLQPYDIGMQGGFSMSPPSILDEANLLSTLHLDQQVPRENACQFVSDTRAEMMDMTDVNPPTIVITFKSMSTENIAFLQYPHLQNGNKGRRKIINPDSKTEKGCTSQTLHRHKLHRKLVQLIRQEICRQEVIDPTTVEFVLNQVEEWEGKVCLHFFEPKKTLEAECYIELLDEVILSACEEMYPDGNFCTNKMACRHTSTKTLKISGKASATVNRRIEWPGYSLDMYSRGMPPNLNELKDCIKEAYEELDTVTIREWLQELRPKLAKIIEENGKPIQQYFNKI
uniref:Uncharacterized protein n=1 Tax=Acrobeloides nanus TaxID=290746 RepID=A0A914EME9_9BILA